MNYTEEFIKKHKSNIPTDLEGGQVASIIHKAKTLKQRIEPEEPKEEQVVHETKVILIGNSLGVRLSKKLLEKQGLVLGTEVEVRLQKKQTA